MNEVLVFLVALNPYGLMNWLAALYCIYTINNIRRFNGTSWPVGVLAVINIVFGILNVLVRI